MGNIKRFSTAGAAAASSLPKEKKRKEKKIMKKSGGPEQSGQSDSEEAESEAEDEDFEISQKDSCVSWAVMNSLTVGELKAVSANFCELQR